MSTENAWYMVDKLREILQSDCFGKDSFDDRRLKLSQAFCLLWQEKDTGEVAGRQKSGATAAGAIVAVLIDLLILGKIEFEAELKQWMTRRREIIYVKACDLTPCGTFLDKAMFSSILAHEASEHNKPKTVNECIIDGSSTFPTCATEVLESLVDMEIFGKKDVLFWRKYPTKNPDPEKELVDEIRRIVLSGHPVDGYMWTLLKLMKDVDSLSFRKGTFLPKIFTPDEMAEAIASVNKITHVHDDSKIENNELVALQEINGEKSDEGTASKEESSTEQAAEVCKLEDVKVEDKEGESADENKEDSRPEEEKYESKQSEKSQALDAAVAGSSSTSDNQNEEEEEESDSTENKDTQDDEQLESNLQGLEDQENEDEKEESEKMEKEDAKDEKRKSSDGEQNEDQERLEQSNLESKVPEHVEADKETFHKIQSAGLNTKL